jgi:pimeloyl-ACP methyl ester carboxylesterase
MFSTNKTYINGLELHYQEWGRKGDPEVILLHGWSTSAPVWYHIAEDLSRDHHVLVPDSRGNGESTVPTTGWKINDFADDLRLFIGELTVTRPMVIGSSWGANIATFLAAQHPEMIGGAVLADPVYWKMLDAFATVVPSIVDRLLKPESEVRDQAIAQGFSDDEVERNVYLHYHFSKEAIMHVATENREWAFECEYFLARVAVPTLVLVADENVGGYITASELDHLRAVASDNVDFRLWTGVSHDMLRLAPQRLVREVREFLSAAP